MPTSAETTTIEIDRRTADALRTQARARGLSLDSYLRLLAAPAGEATPGDDDSTPDMAEFDRWLGELSAGFPAAGSLPADFSRADIYHDHD